MTNPNPFNVAPPPPPPKSLAPLVLIVVLGLVALAAVGCLATVVRTINEPITETTVEETTVEETYETEPEPEAESPSEPKPSPTKTEPKMTKSQENAVEAGLSYLDSGAFSKKGLTEQLRYEEFPKRDVEFAVNYIERTKQVDWNAEAAESAESYLDSGSFSRSSLIKQLRYEGFTQAQAEYGVKRAGL